MRKHPIKKHHWVLGSLLIIAGSWMTHNTTANISENPQPLPIVDSDNSQLLNDNTNLLLAYNSTAPFFSTDSAPKPRPPAYLAPSSPAAKDPVSNLYQPLEFFKITTEKKLNSSRHIIKKGDSLEQIFKQFKFDSSLPYQISRHKQAKQLSFLSIGNTITFKTDDKNQLNQIQYPIDPFTELHVNVNNGKIIDSKVISLPFETKQHTASGEIKNSLYESAQKAGLSDALIVQLADVFAWDIDFSQDIHRGDHFHVLYEIQHINGKRLNRGKIVAAEFSVQGKVYRAVRYIDNNGEAQYYTPQGDSLAGAFLRSPVKFSRISSKYGRRQHPISRKWRTHKGVDYAARSGTPIRATASGKVIHAGRKGGYGKTVIIKHRGKYSTLYAHMRSYAKGIRSGKKVRQGQIIGYVGTTGMSTGPHLHYEFRVNGVHRNPLTNQPIKRTLIAKSKLPEFKQQTKQYLAKLENAKSSYRLAKLKASKGM